MRIRQRETDTVVKIKEFIRLGVIGSADQGKKVREQIEKPLKDGSRVILDFEGISGYSVVGIKEALEWAVKKYGDEVFDEKIVLRSMTGSTSKKYSPEAELVRCLGVKEVRR
jgi:hypothetical protein